MQDLLCLRQVVPFDDRRPLRVPGFDLAGPLLQSATHEADFVVFFLLLLRFEGYHVVLSFADVSPAVQRADEAPPSALCARCLLTRCLLIRSLLL